MAVGQAQQCSHHLDVLGRQLKQIDVKHIRGRVGGCVGGFVSGWVGGRMGVWVGG